jgi:hypothetical protein
VLSPWVGSRAEREKWIRDRRAALYEDYIVAAEKARRMTDSYVPEDNLYEHLGDSASRLGLYASAEVQDRISPYGSGSR